MKFISVVRDLEPLAWKIKVVERHNIKFKPVQTFKQIVIYLKFTVKKDTFFRHGNCRCHEAPIDQDGWMMILMRHDNKELGLQNRCFRSRFSGDHEAEVDRETRATGARYFFRAIHHCACLAIHVRFVLARKTLQNLQNGTTEVSTIVNLAQVFSRRIYKKWQVATKNLPEANLRVLVAVNDLWKIL